MIARRDILHNFGAGAVLGLTPRLAFAAEPDPWMRAAAIARTVKPPVFPARDFDVTRFGA